jgi:threonine dehydratase
MSGDRRSKQTYNDADIVAGQGTIALDTFIKAVAA